VEFKFRVTPPLWRRWWAYLLYLGIAVGLTFAGVRARIRTLANRNRLLEERIAERTTELAEAVEQLQAANADTSRKNRELDEKIAELEASQRQADRIFSALSEALPGTVLDDKYRLDEKIGAGGFGAVFKATHLGLNRPIAVKVFKPMPGNDSANAVERFKLEGVSVARLNHRNIVSVIDSGISREGIAYLVMELLQGHSLYEEVCAKRPVPLGRCLQVLVPVCRALAEAHGNGVVHRDIKPSNIFLNRSEEGEVVKVVDFGTAKLLDPEDDDVFERLTETGAIIGTPNYLAPERIGGKPYDGRSDVYGVGIVFYQMLCGRVPFQPNQGNAMNILVSHLNTPPPPPSSFNPAIHPEVERVCLHALEKSPEMRPTAEEFAVELETLREFIREDELAGSSDGWFPFESDREAAFPTLGNFSNFENAPATQKFSGPGEDVSAARTWNVREPSGSSG
jgi:serine/threonine protein kinase